MAASDRFPSTTAMQTGVRWFAMAMLLLTTGCMSTPLRGHRDLLEFIADDATRRPEVLERLGTPNRSLRGGSICTYRIARDKAGLYVSAGTGPDWNGVESSLVLVFDDDGILRRHALVGMHGGL